MPPWLNSINCKLIYGAFYLKQDPDKEIFTVYYEYGFPYSKTKLSRDFFLGFIRMILEIIDTFDGDI